jgi:hypothetical protein
MHDSSCEIVMGLIFRLVAKHLPLMKVWRDRLRYAG